MDLELRNKRALVTGGSRGIGKAIARELAKEGASVALLARDADRLAAAAAELARETGANVIAVVADTTDDAQVARAVAGPSPDWAAASTSSSMPPPSRAAMRCRRRWPTSPATSCTRR